MQVMTPALAIEAIHKSDKKGRVEFLYRNHQFLLRRATGKHAHFTVLLLPSDRNHYARRFLSPKDAVQERPEQVRWLTSQWLPTVVLRKENFANRIGKALWLNQEVQFGDPVFDDSIYIDTRASAEIVTAMLGEAKVRGAVMTLNKAFPLLTLFHKDAVIHCHHGGVLKVDDETQFLEDALNKMILIAGQLPSIRIKTPGNVPMARSSWVSTLCFLSMIFFLCTLGAAHEWWPTFENVHLKWPALMGLGLWVLLVPVLWVLVRGFSNSLLCLCVSMCFSLVMMSPMVISVGTFLNTVSGSVEAMPVEIESKNIYVSKSSKGGSSTSYQVWLRPMDDSVETTKFLVSRDEYYRLKLHQVQTILVGRGGLGWVWVEDFAPEAAR